MENGPHPDCEMLFYDGVKVLRVDGAVKTVEKSGQTYLETEVPQQLEEYYDHYSDCYKRCLLLESSLSSLETLTGHSYFPAIIGRKPVTALNDSATPLQGKENVSRNPFSPPVVRIFS